MKGVFTSWTVVALFTLLSVSISTSFAQSNHTVSFTGNSADFNAAEGIAAAAGNTSYYITYDAGNLYLGAFRTSGSFNTTDNFTVYLDTDPNSTPTSGTGTTAGQSYNGVTGTLPFTANYNVHAEESYQEARSEASSWASTISGVTYNTGSTWREVTIPFSSIGNPDALYITMWMGLSGGIFSNAPGADLGGAANPTVTDYIGGFGVSSVDCIPVNTTNTPITASLTDAVPSSGITYGKVTISAASITATNNFNIASGGSIQVTGGSFDISGRSIVMGGSVSGNGLGTTINYSGGTLTTSSATSITFNGEGLFTGSPMTYEGALVINRKFTPLSGGSTTLGTAASLDLRANSFVNTNALTYSAGSTLMYNTGSTYAASTEWLSNLSTGTGVPSNVTIGNQVANSVVSFGSSTQFRQANGDVNISNATSGNGLTLSSAAGGDLRIAGDFTQNGTLTANARTLTLNGASAQTYSGTGTDNINTLVISNTGGLVSLNKSITIGAALTFNATTSSAIGSAAVITMPQGTTFTANNAGSTVSVNGTLRNTGTTGATINSTAAILSFGSTGVYDHNMTRSGNNLGAIPTATWNTGSTVLISGFTNPTAGSWFSAGGGQTFRNFTWNTTAMSTAPNMGGAVLTATGTFTITSTNGQEIRMGGNSSGTITCGGFVQSAGILNMSSGTGSGTLNCSGTFNQTGGTITETGTGTAHLIHFNGSSNQNITFAASPGTDINYRFNNAAGFTFNSALSISNNRTVTHTQGAFSGAGSISYGATGTNLVYNGNTLITTSNYEWPSTNSPVNVTINNSGGVSLHAARTISGVLTMTTGIFSIGNNNLTISNNATTAIAGTYSASNMIAITGTGQLIRAVATGGNTYIWPVGETTGTAEYSPASLVFTANNTARNIGVIVTDADHPQVNNSPVQTDYISRYWSFTNSAGGTYTYTGSFTFAAADLTGSQSNIRANSYSGTTWTQDAGSSSTGNVLTTTTGLTQATGPITTTTEVTGRVNNGNSYIWNQTGTNSWATAGNWTPSRTTPRTDDILIFNNGSTTTATNVPNQTIGQLLISGNTNVSLTTTAGNTLTIAGNNGADLSVGSGSTLQIASAGGNSLTVAFANSTVSTIDGTLTLGANTALTNAINFTNTSATVNGTINSQGVITSTGSNLNFAASSFYNHNFTATTGTIPTATWNANSTCRIQGYTSGGGANFAPGGLAQSFGNFTWNCSGQTANAQLNGALTTINGNFTVSNTGGQDLRLTDASSYTLNVGGNMVVSTNNTSVRLGQGNGSYTTIINVAGSYTQSNTSTLNLGNGDANTTSILRVAGAFNFNAGTITQTAATTTGGVALIEFNGSLAQTITASGSFSNTIDFRFDNPAGFTVTGTIPVNENGTCYRTAGALSGGTFTYNSTNSDLVYEGTTAMTTSSEFPASNGPVNVTVNSTNVISLHASRTLPATGIFTNTSGVFSLGSNDLTLNNTAAAALTNSSPSASNMIAADGSGQLRRALPASARDLQFYIGDITGTTEYSAIRLNFTANSTTRIVGVRVVDAASPDIATPYAINDYLSRHWIVTLSTSTGTFTYTPTLTYSVSGDVNGVENNLQVAAFPLAATAWNHYATSITSPSIVTSGSLNQGSFALNNATFTGRTPVMYWTGAVSTNWNTAGNWNTGAVPTSTDNIDISTATPNPCVLSGTATVNHMTLNQSGSLSLGSGAALTVTGNFTYVNTATASFDCNSTLSITNTVFNQTVPALTYGNLNLGTGARTLANAGTIFICGNYTPTTGALTTSGSTVNFSGTTAQSILTNATSFNNLTISNTSASVSATPNVGITGVMQINPNARFNKTGGTLTINSGASANVDGFLRNSGTVTPTGTLTFTSTGTYEHNTTAPGTIMNATWNTGSTCELIGNFSSGTLNCQNQNFHHFKVNYTGSGNVDCNGTLDAMNGDFTCQATGTGDFIIASADVNVVVLGNFNQTGGSMIVSDGNNNTVLVEVAGNFSQTGGDLDMCNGNTNSDGDFNLDGNYSRTGNGNIITSGLTGNGIFNFVGTTQTITETSTGTNTWINYEIENGSTTSLLSDLTLDGSTGFIATLDINNGGILDCGTWVIDGANSTRVRVNSGSTIRTANVDGINSTGSSGSVQTVTRTFNSGASYEYNGSSNQNTGTFFTSTSTANTVTNLIFNNTASTVTLNSGTSPTVTGVMTFGAANTANFNVGAQTIYASSTAIGAVVRTGSGHVIGNLRRGIIPSATNTYTFHIGTSTGYSPVVSALTMGAGAGSIIARATDGSHPNMATDGLSQTAYVNRYWTMTNSGSTVTSASHEFNYIPADLLGGATVATLRLARYSAGWTLPAYTSATDKITGTSLTNTTGFGDFFAAADCSNYTATITPGGATTFCDPPGSVALTASSNITGSTYIWSPATGLDTTTGANVVASPTSTTTYTVTATSPQNCVDTETITITVNPRPTGVISGTQTICNGSSAVLSIAVTGTGPWSGTLSSGASFSGSTSPITVSVSPSSATTYTIASLSDANCTSTGGDLTGSAIVSVNTRPTGVLSGSGTICAGGSIALSIVVTGTGPWSGTLSNGDTFSGSVSPISVSVSPSSTETLTIATLSDANCSALAGDLSGSSAITVVAAPFVSINGTDNLCYGGSSFVNFNGLPNATVTYTINGGPNQTIVLNAGGFNSLSTGSLTSNTSYDLVDVSNGVCTLPASGSAVLTVAPALTAGISATSPICQGSATNINFTGTPLATITYNINGGSDLAVVLNGSGTATVSTGLIFSSSITYNLVSIDDGNCSNAVSGSAVINTTEAPEAEISGSTAICSGSSATISFAGTPGATVVYTINGGPNQTILLNGSGNASLSTGALTGVTSYDLVDVILGGCNAPLTGSAVVTMLSNAYFLDADGDGFGDAGVSSCTPLSGYVANNTDCNDADANVNPNTNWYADIDGDGYGSYIYVTQCSDPLVSGVVSLGGDCNDNNALIYPGATEVCANGVDDDCDGFVDEGCIPGPSNDGFTSAVNVNTSGIAYPAGNCYNGTTLNATVSPQGTAANVLPAGGQDVWYKIVAPSPGLRVNVTTSAMDVVLELHNSGGALIDTENVISGTGGEIMSTSGLTEGATYFIAVRSYTGTTGAFSICVQALMDSECETGSGNYDLCTNLKPKFTSANQYIYHFTPTSFAGPTVSYTANGQIALSLPALGLIHGETYDVTIDSYFNVQNAAPASDAQTVVGTTVSSITIANHADLRTKSTQVCPATIFKGTTIQAKPFICSTVNNTIEFQEVTDCTGSTTVGPIFTTTTSGASPNKNLAQVGGIQAGKWYKVRWRPNFSYGPGVYGSYDVIQVVASSAAEDEDMSSESESDLEISIYPNPTKGEQININMQGLTSDVIFVKILDQTGKLVYNNQFVAQEELITQIEFTETLSNGIYLVEILDGANVHTKKLMVTK